MDVTPPAPDITVVIPAKNEHQTVAEVVRHCFRYAADVLVVDGRSTDGTADQARQAGARVIEDPGRGKGVALRLAMPHIRSPITVFLDADGSHDPADVPKLVRPIRDNEADHVSASRLTGGSSELHGGFDEFLRLAGSSFITACINWRFGVRLSDSQNGFRAIRTDVLRQLALTETLTTIEQELIIKTLKGGFRMTECPSHEYPRKCGRSHIRLWRVAPVYVFSLVRHLFF
jgi:glycosyltransferase involved in cell wall biosynthesis